MLERKEHKQTNSQAVKEFKLPRFLTDKHFPSEESEAKKFYAELANSKTVVSLTIRECELMESYRKDALELCKEHLLSALCKNTSIKEFNYHESVRGAILFPILSKWFDQTKSLQDVTFFDIRTAPKDLVSALEKLNFIRSIKFFHFANSSGANQLAALIAKMPALQELSTWGVYEADSIAISRAVAQHKSVQSLKLEGRFITNGGLKIIVDILKECHFLRVLNLSLNMNKSEHIQINDFSAAFDDVFSLVQLNPGIEEIILEGWDLSNEDAIKIASLLEKNSSLRKISLYGKTSKNLEQGMQSIFEALKSNYTLNSVDFLGKVSRDSIFNEEELLKNNENICHLDFSSSTSSKIKSAELYNQRQFFTLFGRTVETISSASDKQLPEDIAVIIANYFRSISQVNQVIVEASQYFKAIVENYFDASELSCEKGFEEMYKLFGSRFISVDENVSLLNEMLKYAKENEPYRAFISTLDEILQCVKEVAKVKKRYGMEKFESKQIEEPQQPEPMMRRR